MLAIVSLIVTLVGTLSISILVLVKDSKRLSNIFFGLFNIAVSLWAVANFFSIQELDYNLILFLMRLTMASAVLQGYFYLLFVVNYPNPKDHFTLKYLALSIFSLIALILTFTPLLFESYEKVETGALVPIIGPAMPIFLFSSVIYILAGIIVVFKKMRLAEPLLKTQLNYILYGSASMFVMTIFFNFVMVNIFHNSTFIKLGALYVLPFIILTAYSVIKLRFLDIRLVLRRAIVLSGALLITVIITTIIQNLLEAVQVSGYINTAVVVSIAIAVFIYFRKAFLVIANKYFFTTLYDRQQVTEELAAKMSRTLNFTEIISIITGKINNVLGLEKNAFILYHDNEGIVRASIESNKGIDVRVIENVFTDSSVLKYLKNLNTVIVTDEIPGIIAEKQKGRVPQDVSILSSIYSSINETNISVVIPLVAGGKLVSVLLLGPKLSNDAFTSEDVHLLETISDQAGVAIENAQLYNESQIFNEKLKSEVASATKELRSANENLKKLDEAKSEFMSIASHQLRTPLAGILGYLSMMLQGDYGKFEETQEKTIQEVFQASQRLVRLVNTFLNVTRIEAGRFTLTYVDTNIIDVVEQQVKELLPTANKKGLKLSFEKPEQTEIMAAVDDKIRDVFINLVDNAIKYTQEGSVTVHVMDEGDTVHFTCTDTGVGIAPEEAKNLFQKFVRGSEIARVQPDGSGLGLYIVKRVVDGHHGEIWAASEGVGKGTTFHVVVPKHQAEESFKAEAEQIFTGAKNVGTDEEIPLEDAKK